MPVARVSVRAGVLAHGRNKYAVRKGNIPNRQRIKQVGHGAVHSLSQYDTSCPSSAGNLGNAIGPGNANHKSMNGSLLRLGDRYDPGFDSAEVVFGSQQDLQPPHPRGYRDDIADFR
jgi:hypothetical protein